MRSKQGDDFGFSYSLEGRDSQSNGLPPELEKKRSIPTRAASKRMAMRSA
jgi:hypothetical protein